MKVILSQISGALRNVLGTFFTSDFDVMSDEVRKILSNPDDAKKYREAVDEIESGKKKEKTIVLSDNRELTLIQ